MVSEARSDKRESLGGGLYRRYRNGKTFFELRLASGMSQEELAHQAEIDRTSVS